MFASPLRFCGPMKNINCIFSLGNGNIGQIIALIGRKNYSSDKNQGKCCKDILQSEGKRVEPWPKQEPQLPPSWRYECSREPQPPNYDPYRIKVPDVVVPPLPPSNAKPALECAKIKGPCTTLKAPDPPPCPPPPREPFPWIYVYAAGAFITLMGLIYKMHVWREEFERVSDAKPIWRPRRVIKRPYHDSDLPACVQYLIVGTGEAGWAAYEAIMENDKTAKVFFITKDDLVPYDRRPMSKTMWWNKDPPDITKLHYVEDGRRYSMFKMDCEKFMDPVKFYRKKNGPAVSIATGWCVLSVDADDHVAYVKTMGGEQPIYYERCLLAPGSKAKNLRIFKSAPKAVREKMTPIRNIRDFELAFRRVRASKHVVVVGAGPLGTELAWHLGHMNKVVEREDGDDEPIQIVHVYKDRGILSGIIPEYLGEWAAEVERCEGVQLMPQTQVYDAFMTPEGKLQLTLSDGSSLLTDYVVVAVGAEPRMELAEPSFLEQDHANGGFLVNTEMEARTHLYVAGDAASVYSQWKDTRIRFEHFDNATETGAIAGANMTGQWLPCNVEPHYWITLGHMLEIEVVGEVGACMPTIGLFKPCEDDMGDPAPTLPPQGKDQEAEPLCYKKGHEYKNLYKRGLLFYLRDEVIVGVLFWNIPTADDRKGVVTELLRAKPTYKDINMIADMVGFPDTECTYKTSEEKASDASERPPLQNCKEW